MNVEDILKIKDNFPNLLSEKIEDINRTINNIGKPKPYINITTKGLSHKQIIISIGTNNIKNITLSLGKYIVNINRALKSIKSEIIVNSIHTDHYSLIINSNKVASQLDLSMIEKYIKNVNYMNLNDVQSAQLSQSKLYLKILDILYIIKETNIPFNLNVVKSIIKSTHIFENIYIASKLCAIKVSPKLDMFII